MPMMAMATSTSTPQRRLRTARARSAVLRIGDGSAGRGGDNLVPKLRILRLVGRPQLLDRLLLEGFDVAGVDLHAVRLEQFFRARQAVDRVHPVADDLLRLAGRVLHQRLLVGAQSVPE